jgi:TPR repeat protein
MIFYEKYLKYKNKYLKVKKQIGGMKNETFEYNGKIINADVPTDIICVISFDIMNDPVILSDGHSYERVAIIEWLKTHNTSPKTGAQLTNRNVMMPNHTLKATIEELKKEIYYKKLNEQISELKKQVDNGDSCATNKLGLMYKNGIGLVVQDYEKALKYFERAEQLGNNDVFFHLGEIYDKSLGVKQDYPRAIGYYERALQLGNIDALINLGNLYYSFGVLRDYTKAKVYYERAAKLGNSDALYKLGMLYKNGFGVKQDYVIAKDFFEKADNLGNSTGLINLGAFYKNGLGVKQDYSTAIKYYKRAAELDNNEALFNLGWLYQHGLGVEQNFDIAKEYYKKAAKLGHSNAKLTLEILNITH